LAHGLGLTVQAWHEPLTHRSFEPQFPQLTLWHPSEAQPQVMPPHGSEVVGVHGPGGGGGGGGTPGAWHFPSSPHSCPPVHVPHAKIALPHAFIAEPHCLPAHSGAVPQRNRTPPPPQV
jgi:hypothetical protein